MSEIRREREAPASKDKKLRKKKIIEGAPIIKRTSLKQISGITGYSITTVSMVLNGRASDFNISRDTSELILATAKKYNYQPNLHARSLRNGTTNLLGLMVPTLYNHFFGEMAETYERLARNNNKIALITVTHYEPQEEIDTLNYFLSQNVDCVFTANPMAIDEISDLCTRGGIKQILLDAPQSTKPTVTTDNFEASLVLTRMLLSSMTSAGRLGRIYYVGGMVEHQITMQRLAGFKAALREQGIGFSDDQFIQTHFNAENANEKIEELFHSHNDIGGIFLNSLLALDGLVRFFPRQPEICRQIHYGIFDYHPILNLLIDLKVLVIKQNADLMMEKAYELFSGNVDPQEGTVHCVPYEIVLTPAMRPYFHNIE